MRHFKKNNGQVYAYSESQAHLIERILNDGAEEIIDYRPESPPPISQEEIKFAIRANVQEKLDGVAREWGYFNILSALSYGMSNKQSYASESRQLSNWRDSVWDWVFVQLEKPLSESDIEIIPNGIPAPPQKPGK